MSGADSALENVWDEICVQVQGEESYSWSSYEQTAKHFVSLAVEALSPELKMAIWLQTDNGSVRDDEGGEPDNISNDVVEYISNGYIYSQAGNWTNKRIEAYLFGNY